MEQTIEIRLACSPATLYETCDVYHTIYTRTYVRTSSSHEYHNNLEKGRTL